jgi:hypothetical protein
MFTSQSSRYVPTKRPAASSKHTRSLAKKDWAMLAYIGGDNDLSDNGVEDVTEMCAQGTDATLYGGVEIDTLGEHTGSVRYEISEPDVTGIAYKIEIERLPERDTGNPKTLTAFLDWGLRRYDATNRLMVVWGHGSGFRAPKRDVAFDDFGSSLDMPEVELALSRAGIGKGKPFGKLKIMGFDACLMSMIEIVHHFKDQTELVVGSQQTEPGNGWPYDKVLARAKGNPSVTALASAIVAEYIKNYRASGESNVTQSAIDAGKTPAAVTALHDLGKALLGVIDQQRPGISHSRSQAQAFDYADYVDLIHLAGLLARNVTDVAAKRATANVIATAKASIIANGRYGNAMKNANGLSVWFPPTRDLFAQNRAKYLRLHSNDARQDWVDLLDAYWS